MAIAELADTIKNLKDMGVEVNLDPNAYSFTAEIIRRFMPNSEHVPDDADQPFFVGKYKLGFNPNMPLDTWLAYLNVLIKMGIGNIEDSNRQLANLAFNNLVLYEGDDGIPVPVPRDKIEQMYTNKAELLIVPRKFGEYVLFFIKKSLK